MKSYQQLLSKQIHGHHYYDTMGNARYDANTAEAQIENLLPSITTMGKKDNPGITQSRINGYMLETMRMAAEGELIPIRDQILLDNLGERHDSIMDDPHLVDEMKSMVTNQMQEKGFEAAEFGRSFHGYLESYANGFRENGQQPHAGPDVPAEHKAQWGQLKSWFDNEVTEVYETEAPVVNLKRKCAGTLDLFCHTKSHGDTLLDLKSQNVYIRKDGSPSVKSYDEWPEQLAQYQDGSLAQPTHEKSVGFNLRKAKPINLVISSGEPIKPFVKTYDKLEMDEAREKFELRSKLWQMENFSIEVSTENMERLENRMKRAGNKEIKTMKEQCLGLIAKDLHKKTFNAKSHLGENYKVEDVESAVRLCHGYPPAEGTRLPFAEEDLNLVDDPRKNFDQAVKLMIDQEEASLCQKHPAKDDPGNLNGTGKRRLESLKKRAHEACDHHDAVCTEMSIPRADMHFSRDFEGDQKQIGQSAPKPEMISQNDKESIDLDRPDDNRPEQEQISF